MVFVGFYVSFLGFKCIFLVVFSGSGVFNGFYMFLWSCYGLMAFFDLLILFALTNAEVKGLESKNLSAEVGGIGVEVADEANRKCFTTVFSKQDKRK